MIINTANWKTYGFSDLANNLTMSIKDPLSVGYKRYVGLEHIEPENMHIKSWGNVKDGTTFTRIFRKGQVLFGKRRAYQKKAALADFDGVCSGDILVFEANEENVIPELLPFIVHSDKFFDYAIKTSAGSLSPRTKFKDLGKLKFKLPTLSEQKQLSDLLWSGDVFIEKSKKLLEETCIFNRVKMDQLLNAKHMIVHKNTFPKGWKEKTISELGVISTSSVNKKIKKGEKVVNLINYMDVYKSEDKKITSGIEFMQVSANENQLIKNQVQKGDILFTPSSETSDDIGHSAVVYESSPETLYSYHLVRLRFYDEHDLDLEYKRFVFNNPRVMRYFTSRAKGVTRMTLSLDDFRKARILVPTLSEQKKIAKAISDIIEIKMSLEKQIKKSQYVQKQLINKIFG
ncbi:MAG: restriction endonuclease subunit S [Candidatus Tantalella remota]|nr:restriction endonuclease subunit S [Candidatus Tantalella remota]